MNHLGPADDHRTEARRERSKKSPPRRGDEKIDRRRKTARRRASRIWRRRTSIVGFGRSNDDGDESERSEYEREERARGVDVWRRRSRGEERKVEEGDVMAEVANETWKNGYIDDGRGQWIITGMAEDMEESGIDRWDGKITSGGWRRDGIEVDCKLLDSKRRFGKASTAVIEMTMSHDDETIAWSNVGAEEKERWYSKDWVAYGIARDHLSKAR
jgi:uncharacterized protein YkuJ